MQERLSSVNTNTPIIYIALIITVHIPSGATEQFLMTARGIMSMKFDDNPYIA